MNREIQTPNDKSFLQLIQCSPLQDADEDNYHNGLDWDLQIDAVLAFTAQCPSHCNIKTTSGGITTARCAQAVTSCSEHFAKPKCYYALMLTTFELRLNLIQLLSILLCLYTCTQFNDILCFPFSWLLLLVHFTLMYLYIYALIC